MAFIRRGLRRLLPAVFALGVAFAPGLASGAESAPDELVSLQLNNVDGEAVVRLLEMYTGRTALRPAQLPPATITLVVDKPISRPEAVAALETLLALNQIGVTAYGDHFLKIVSLSQIKAETPVMVSGSTLDLPPGSMIATKLFVLQAVRLNEFVPQLQTILSAGVGGNFVSFEKANAVLITDSVSNLQRVELLLKAIDHPNAPKLYALRFARAGDVVAKLHAAVSAAVQQQIANSASFTADERANQIILISDPRYHPFFDELIARLDVKVDPAIRDEAIYLKHANAREVAALIGGIMGNRNQSRQKTGSQAAPSVPGPPAAAAPAPATALPPADTPGAAGGSDLASTANEFSPFINLQADERSNGLIVSGTADDLRLMHGLVDKLDVALAQVRIEVVIAEVSLGDSAASGISQLGLVLQGDKLVGFNGATAGLTVSGSGGAVDPGAFATITRPLPVPGISGPWDLAGLLSIGTTPRKDNTTILSVPSITTTHNKEATVFVGETRPVVNATQSVPVGTGAGLALSTASTVTQQDIGISLKVKPLVGADGSVQLDIKQEVAEVGATVTIDNNAQPIVLKRNASSFVSARSGEIIVLGGLQKQTRTRTTSRLGGVPIIGDLLGARSRSNVRTELIFFVRPIVLTDTPVDNAAALRAVDQMPHRDDVRRELDPASVPDPAGAKP